MWFNKVLGVMEWTKLCRPPFALSATRIVPIDRTNHNEKRGVTHTILFDTSFFPISYIINMDTSNITSGMKSQT